MTITTGAREASTISARRETDATAWHAARPGGVDWRDLVAKCEARRIPVMRLDRHGDAHLIRTTEQLLTEWED